MNTSQATRRDAATSVEETFAFFGRGPERLAGVTYLPSDVAVGSVLMVPSLFSDEIKNYRREVDLARAMAAAGYCAQRFHYRGTGHSDGSAAEMTYDRMVDDILTAADQLRRSSGVAPEILIATRFGALLAGAVAARLAIGRVLLVEPILEAGHFFREGIRAKLVRELGSNDGDTATPSALMEQLTVGGALDVLGYTLHRALYETFRDRSFVAELGNHPIDLGLVQLGGDEPRPPLVRLAADHSPGARIIVLAARETWWFLQDEQIPTALMTDQILQWVSGHPSERSDGGDDPR